MATSLARSLRRDPTDAERLLWSKLRDRRLDGWKFKRQAPRGPYVVDFACLEALLIVEVDGGQHDWRDEHDASRTAWLENQGFRVIRFWNNEVLGNIDGVLQTIVLALRGSPSPHPSPRRGEGDLPRPSSSRGASPAPSAAPAALGLHVDEATAGRSGPPLPRVRGEGRGEGV